MLPAITAYFQSNPPISCLNPQPKIHPVKIQNPEPNSRRGNQLRNGSNGKMAPPTHVKVTCIVKNTKMNGTNTVTRVTTGTVTVVTLATVADISYLLNRPARV